jgi:hypothetical protein
MTSIAKRRFEASARVPASAEDLFAYMHDPSRLAGHMESGSWAMAGGRMSLSLDEGGGRRMGSHMLLGGLGNRRCSSCARHASVPDGLRHRLRVSIVYGIPETVPARWLTRIFGPAYARWCTERMLADAVCHFGPALGKPHGLRAAR